MASMIEVTQDVICELSGDLSHHVNHSVIGWPVCSPGRYLHLEHGRCATWRFQAVGILSHHPAVHRIASSGVRLESIDKVRSQFLAMQARGAERFWKGNGQSPGNAGALSMILIAVFQLRPRVFRGYPGNAPVLYGYCPAIPRPCRFSCPPTRSEPGRSAT